MNLSGSAKSEDDSLVLNLPNLADAQQEFTQQMLQIDRAGHSEYSARRPSDENEESNS